MDTTFTPHTLKKHIVKQVAPNLEHSTNPTVHPVTGETISSYKKLMGDPATEETWQMAFGNDFGGMAQGDNKTGQKGTNAMFVMTHEDIKKILKAGKKITYANPVVDHCPQKEDPNRIRITAGGNPIDCNGEHSVPTANIVTAKLHWNSVVSTATAKYMYIDIKIVYLSAALEYFEYMKIPITMFPR